MTRYHYTEESDASVLPNKQKINFFNKNTAVHQYNEIINIENPSICVNDKFCILNKISTNQTKCQD